MKNQRGGAGGMQALIRQANQVQVKIKKLQEDLSQKEYFATAAGGALKITLQGETVVKSVDISDEFYKEGDRELLQSLMVTCLNEALTSAKKDHEEQMQKITGNLNIPGL
jgi:nucleoid-associated protein EbfC